MKRLRNLLLKIYIPNQFSSLRPGESGQSIIILAFVFLGLLAMLGLALDLGLVYVERIRIKRTVDAAVLAAVAELPTEEEAALRAITYLDENGYDMNEANVYIAGCVQDLHNEFNLDGTATGGGDPVTRDDLVNLPTGNMSIILPTATDTLTPTNFSQYYHYIRYDSDGDNEFDDEKTTFFIDTRSFQDKSDPGTSELCDIQQQVSVTANDFGSAPKIRIYGEVKVPMSFMQFFGFPEVNVSDEATAQTATSLDVVVVLDTTGSMEFDTICYGCWARCGDKGNQPSNAPLISAVGGPCDNTDDTLKYRPYPDNGWAFPFDYYGATMTNLREGNGGVPRPDTGDDYIIIEAEFYSHNSSNWRPGERTAETGYWAIQRIHTADAYAIDGYGYSGTPSGTGGQKLSGMIRHHPYFSENSGNPFGRDYTLDDAKNDASPRLEYDFYPTGATWGSNTYIYLRAQRTNEGNDFYWSIDDWATTNPSNYPKHAEGGYNVGNAYSPGDDWSWVKLGPISVGKDMTHVLKIWAGDPGYGIDRIIITDQNVDMNNNGLRDDPATPGSAQRLAADICNPIFGLTVFPGTCSYLFVSETTNNLNDPLFGDVDPIRGAQEAVRGFVGRLDPQVDQAGFVDFAGDGWQRAQMECQRASRARQTQAEENESFNTQRADYPLDHTVYGEYDEFVCHDGTEAITGTVPISYTNVFMSIEDANPPGGNTDIADGLRRGLHMLGINTDDDDGGNHANDCDWDWRSSWWRIHRDRSSGSSWLSQPLGIDSKSTPVESHCARGQAAQPIIVLLTDGAPTNSDPGDNDECRAWGASNPAPYEGFPLTDNKFECIMYYAEEAAAHGVIVYPIGLGVGADRDLLAAVADVTHGQDYYVLSASQLDIIFDEILANIYIRLIK
jgi:Flp pilus assembly protein TadG